MTPEIAIDILGLPGARVLGTPFMIMWMEMTCRNSVLPLLGEGYDTVGTEVCIRHLAATPIGKVHGCGCVVHGFKLRQQIASNSKAVT